MKKSLKKRISNRLRILEGQIRGLQRMVEEEKYCMDILHQTAATKEALSGVEDLLLENHLSTHVVEQMKSKNTRKAIKEMLEVYKLSKKK
ncbi:MAG: metal-sensitive transcriptional regulator [Patescibacteria group bacterium]|nr:metal-sensitive transcriptional regulator [Patescibacteria group bacterium]